MKIEIKPLSVNQCWQGQRFKSPKYKAYEKELLLMLKPISIPLAPFKISFEFGLSNSLSDWDNPVKPFQDILQKRYGFNDRDIIEATVKKTKVKKGEEFIRWNLESLL